MIKIVAKLFRGEYPLGKSYWLFGNIVPFFLFLAILISIFAFSNNPIGKLQSLNFKPESLISTIITILLSIITLIYICISTVGVWRSASKHEGKKIWAILAKLTIILAFITYLNDIRKFFF